MAQEDSKALNAKDASVMRSPSNSKDILSRILLTQELEAN